LCEKRKTICGQILETNFFFLLGDLAISDTQNSRIQFFNSQGKFLRSFKTEKIRPFAICIDAYQNLIVSDQDSGQINVFDLDGTLIHSFGMRGKDAPGLMSGPWGITVDRNGQIVVSDSGNNRIQVFSPEGTTSLPIFLR
jgi:tripartite motif-containing protein 71